MQASVVPAGDVLEPGALGSELVFISSPTARAGTTLLQRLFSSGPEALVFGEGVGAALIELSDTLAKRERVLLRADEHRRDLARALGGEQFWCPHLLSEPEGFVALYRAALERFVDFHAACARTHGRARWGAKLPGVPVASLRNLRRALPGARIVYVIRDLVAAARSAKARRFLKEPADFARFATLWHAGVSAIHELGDDPRVLVLSYEAIERRGAALVPELEAFTSLSGLDPAVLTARVNTWTGANEEGHAPDQYLAPGDLSDAERALLEHTLCSAAARATA